LSTLPNDPDSGTYYIYQSDGNDCTISASLSSGDIYQYSCVNDVMTIGTSTSGICGSSHNQNYYSAPTENFCAGGFIPTPSVSTTGWTWECPGEYLGADVQCLANKNIDGACGTSANDNFYLSSEITNPCTSGTVTNLVGSGSATGYFTWTCPGAYSGTTASCTANLKVDGVCGINGGYYETLPAAGVRCANGTTPSNTNAWSWYCIGLNEGGNSATCSVTQKQSCSYYGGTTTTCGGISCCKISGSSCPAGYNYLSWTTTTPYSWCSLDADDCKDPSGATAPFTRIGLNNCYYSTSHSWSNATNSGEWISCQWNDEAGTWVTYWSTITEIGCY
ncbi:hypothetical protein M0Q50_05420, partial [bacterium]|nr:hypothetical protein [bacterium]